MTDLHLIDPGLWAEQRTATRGGPALFLDRDGVIVEEVRYLSRVEDVRLTPDAGDLIRLVNSIGFPVVVVTNQAGVGRDYYRWGDFRMVQDEIHRLLALEGAHVDAVYACGYHDEGKPPLNTPHHAWRKPNPGMLLAAAHDVGIDLSRSWIVGDRGIDLAAGRAAGLAGGAQVATGYGSVKKEIADAQALASDRFAVKRIDNLASFDPRWM
jgi:D-glycero-D-manno-heptose 1,7-bisphosphate phosphatase